MTEIRNPKQLILFWISILKFGACNLLFPVYRPQGVISSISVTTPKWRNLPSFTI